MNPLSFLSIGGQFIISDIDMVTGNPFRKTRYPNDGYEVPVKPTPSTTAPAKPVVKTYNFEPNLEEMEAFDAPSTGAPAVKEYNFEPGEYDDETGEFLAPSTTALQARYPKESYVPTEPEGLYEGFVKPTAKSLVKVPASVASQMALFPGAGVAALSEFAKPQAGGGYGTLEDAMRTFKQVMNLPTELLETEADKKAAEHIALIMKPIEMAGEGWGLIGEQINNGLVALGSESTLLEPLLATYGEAAAVFAAPEVIKKVGNSNWFRRLSVRERGLVVQSLAETQAMNPNLTEGQLLRMYDNPTWRAEALAKRSITEDYVKVKETINAKSKEAVVESTVKNKVNKPPKTKREASIKPTEADPEYTFTSKKGNSYEKIGDKWYNSKGEEVTHRWTIKAAEEKKVRFKKEVDEAVAEEQLKQEIEERFKKPIEEVTEKELDTFDKEAEVKDVKVEEPPPIDFLEELIVEAEKDLGIVTEEPITEVGEGEVADLDVESEVEYTLENTRPYDKVDTPGGLLARVEAELNEFSKGGDVDIAATKKLIEQLVEHSTSWARGIEVPPEAWGLESMTMTETLNFNEQIMSLYRRSKKIDTEGVRLNVMVPIDEVPLLVQKTLDLAREVGREIQYKKLYRNKTIWENTGMWLGKDGKWRYEIYEDKAIFYVPKGTQKKFNLKDILDYPELYQAVPKMRDAKVIINKDLKEKGFYHKDTNTIFLRDRENSEVFFHETQHGVNYWTESFLGTSPEMQAVIGRMENSIEYLNRILLDVKSEKAKRYLREVIKDLDESLSRKVVLGKQNLDREMKGVSRHLKKLGEEEASKLVKEPIKEIRDAFTRYMKDPGEMEARLTEERFKMTSEEKRAEAPWETLDKMLVKEGTGRRAGTKLYSGIDPIESVKAISEGVKSIFDGVSGYVKTKILSKPPKPFTIKEKAKELTIGRKSKLGVATYDTNKFVNSVEQKLSRKQRQVMPFVIEKTGIPNELGRPDLQKVLNKDRKQLEPMAEKIKDHFDTGFKRVKDNLKDMSGKQIRDYVTHLWDIPSHKVAEATNWFMTQDRFMEKRFIDTYAEGIKMGFMPKTLDISEIIKIHDAVGNRAIENTRFIKELLNLEHEGVKLIHRGEGAPLDWIEVDYPALTRRIPLPKTTVKRKGEFVKESKVYAHPDLKRPLEVIFGSRFDSPVISAYEALNGIMKKSMLSLNLFHHTELAKVSLAETGLLKTADVYLNPIKIYKAMVRGELDTFKNHEIARDAAEHNMQFGPSADIPVDRIQSWLNDLAGKTVNTPIAGRLTQLTADMNSAWDKALWTYLHDTLKLHAYESAIGRLDPNLSPEMMRKSKIEISQRINDMFGGQNWDILGLTPKEVQMMTWSLLSADWTASTIRQGLSPTGLGKIYKETGGLRGKGGRRFWLRAALYLGIGVNLLNTFFREQDMEENPQYYQDKDKYTWRDKSMFWGNTVGNRTRLFVGRYDDGSERYLRWDKQFEDFFGLLYLPPEKKAKKLFGKTAPVPQALVEISPAGHTLSGFKNDDIYRRKGMEYAKGVMKRLGSSFLPLSTRRAFQESIEWKPTDLFTQSSRGMSRFSAMEYFKYAIVTNDEDMMRDVYIGALRNNLPAFTLFNSSLSWVEAEATRDLVGTTKDIGEVEAKLAMAETPFDNKRWGKKLGQLYKEKADKEAGIQLLNAALTKMEAYVDISGIDDKDVPSLPGRR